MSDFLQTLSRLDEQVLRAWREARRVVLPTSYRSVKDVVVMAMGGSALGVDLIKSALADRITVPISIVNDYRIPASAGKSTLVILSSFSGTTEEVLTAYTEARLRKLKMFVLTNGGELAKRAKRDGVPMYQFDPADLASQPRYGTGFMAMGPLAVLAKIGAVKVSQKEIEEVAMHLKRGIKRWTTEAKKVSAQLKGRALVMVASEHLEGAAHVFSNQANESAKQFSTRFPIPEMNHHLMEGLTFPKSVVKQMTFVFVESSLYHPRVAKRYPLTKTVVQKNGAKILSIKLTGKTPLAQAFELVQRGALITAMLADRAHVDPKSVPWVDWFKARMK